MKTGRSSVIDSEKMSVEEFEWGEIRWLWNSKISQNAEQTFGIVRINPKEKNMTHIHPNCEELLYVVSGECEHGLGDGVHHLKKGMIISIPAGVGHYAVNAGDEPFEAVICYSSPNREVQGES